MAGSEVRNTLAAGKTRCQLPVFVIAILKKSFTGIVFRRIDTKLLQLHTRACSVYLWMIESKGVAIDAFPDWKILDELQ
jgi:hypothetical protein